MTTSMTAAADTRRGTTAGARPSGLRHAVASELTKLRTLRSLPLTLLAMVVCVVGIGVLVAVLQPANVSVVKRYELVKTALLGMMLGKTAIGLLAVLAVTSEYATGAIRTTLAAVPSRGRLLAAKAVVVSGVSLLAGTVTSAASFLIVSLIVGTRSRIVPTAGATVVRALLGGGLYLAVLSLFALAIGVIVRHTAGAITAVFALTLILPTPLWLMFGPSAWIAKWWPNLAGENIMEVSVFPGTLSPWTGFAYFGACTAALLLLGYLRFSRTDA